MTFEELFQLARETKTIDETFPITAAGLLAVRDNVAKWNLPADTFVVSGSLKERFFSEAWFIAIIDPAHKVEDVREGFFGTLFGMKVLVDLKRTMEPNTVAVVSAIGLGIGGPASKCVFKCKMG